MFWLEYEAFSDGQLPVGHNRPRQSTERYQRGYHEKNARCHTAVTNSIDVSNIDESMKKGGKKRAALFLSRLRITGCRLHMAYFKDLDGNIMGAWATRCFSRVILWSMVKIPQYNYLANHYELNSPASSSLRHGTISLVVWNWRYIIPVY